MAASALCLLALVAIIPVTQEMASAHRATESGESIAQVEAGAGTHPHGHTPMEALGEAGVGTLAGLGMALLAAAAMGQAALGWLKAAGLLPGFLSFLSGHRASDIAHRRLVADLTQQGQVLTRVRRAVGLPEDPEEPAPGEGLLADMRRVRTDLTDIKSSQVDQALSLASANTKADSILTALGPIIHLEKPTDG